MEEWKKRGANTGVQQSMICWNKCPSCLEYKVSNRKFIEVNRIEQEEK